MRVEIVNPIPPPPPPADVQITMSYAEARALFAVSNWYGVVSRAVAAETRIATEDAIKETLLDLYSVLSDAGVR